MQLFNTLSQKKEQVHPLRDNIVTLYTCGPTVYDVAHIGNFRAAISYDMIKRSLVLAGFNVRHAMNITDVDDKTIGRSGGDKEKLAELTKKYEDKFWADLLEINIAKPGIVTYATSYIDKMVIFIQDLLDKGFAYKASDGSVYFSIDKFKDYGKLSRLDKEGLKAGARVNQDEYDKESPADFALWKAWDESDGEIFWATTLGKGHPGWHIECSVMSQDVLGDTIDIHAGGIDLMFPHHENEIAQSEARTGKKFVNIWVHNEHLLVESKKMSKSLGNIYTLDQIKAKGFLPLDFRYFVLGAHYRSKINFTWEAMESAKNSRTRLVRIATELKSDNGKANDKYLKLFSEKIKDDINTPEALAVVWELIRDEKVPAADRYTTLIEMDKTLGLGLTEKRELNIPENIIKLAEERKKARENKDWAKSDQLRDEIKKAGWNIEDLKNDNYKLLR